MLMASGAFCSASIIETTILYSQFQLSLEITVVGAYYLIRVVFREVRIAIELLVIFAECA